MMSSLKKAAKSLRSPLLTAKPAALVQSCENKAISVRIKLFLMLQRSQFADIRHNFTEVFTKKIIKLSSSLMFLVLD